MTKESFKKITGKAILFFVFLFFVTGVAFGPMGGVGGVEIAYAAELKAPEGLECFDGLTIQFDHCAALAGFYMFFVPSTWLLIAATTIFDTMLVFSLSNDMLDQQFITTAWEAVRNVANMAFIFVLLYIAIATILNLGNYKKLLVNLVIVALVINFSAFFTKIIIDTSNIFALAFYNAIDAPPLENSQDRLKDVGISNKQSISTVFIQGFDLQNIAGEEAFKQWRTEGENVSMLFFVFLAAGIVTIAASFVLFSVGFLFLGRMVAFWFLIIASPIAFVALILPGARDLFQKWWSALIGQALVAPVFLFFMYVIAMIISSGFLGNTFQGQGADLMDTVINIIVVFLVLLITLIMALNVTKKLSGQAGALASKFAGHGVAGAALKYGTKYGKVAGRFARTQTAGRVMSRAADSRAMKWVGRKAPGAGRAMTAGMDAMGGASYNKYTAKQAKKKVAYGDRISKPSRGEAREMAKIKALPKYSEKQLERLVALEGKERERKVAMEKAYGRPGGIGKITQRITGQDVSEREVAKKIKKGEKGEDPQVENFKKFLREQEKEGSGKESIKKSTSTEKPSK